MFLLKCATIKDFFRHLNSKMLKNSYQNFPIPPKPKKAPKFSNPTFKLKIKNKINKIKIKKKSLIHKFTFPSIQPQPHLLPKILSCSYKPTNTKHHRRCPPPLLLHVSHFTCPQEERLHRPWLLPFLLVLSLSLSSIH